MGSRRACERLIEAGRVQVDGVTVSDLGRRVDPAACRVSVDGRPVEPARLRYLLLHKPAGYLCTSRDPQGRPTFHDLLPNLGSRLYSAGRLDLDSEGLLLVTNDGPLVQRMIHPRHHARKIYVVWVDHPLDPEWSRRLLDGIEDEGERMRFDFLRRRGSDRDGIRYEVVLRQGRKRQIRRMFAAAGCHVRRLLRTAFGPLQLGDLPPGAWRELTPAEIARLTGGIPPAATTPAAADPDEAGDDAGE